MAGNDALFMLLQRHRTSRKQQYFDVFCNAFMNSISNIFVSTKSKFILRQTIPWWSLELNCVVFSLMKVY